MPKLAQLQQDFLTAIHQNKIDVFTQHIHSQTTLTPDKRFTIYQGSITECLAKSLRETYKVCEKLVGEDFFNGLAYTYIQQTPSHSPDLGDYGESFADFIEHFPPAQQLPYLADMCRLCWAYHLAYRAEAELPFDAKSFAKLSEKQQAQTIFKLSKNTRLIESPYPLKAIWDLCQSDETEQSTEPLDLNSGGIKLMVWKNQYTINMEALTEPEWQLTQLLQQQHSLEQLEQHCNSKQIPLAELLPASLIKGWLTLSSIK